MDYLVKEFLVVIGLFAFVVAALFTGIAGRLVLPILVKAKLNDGEQRKASDYLNMLHSDKKNTPTMGGVFLVPVVLAACAGFLFIATQGFGGKGSQLDVSSQDYLRALGLMVFVVVTHASLGLVDDYCKLKKLGKDGLPGKVKLAVQTIASALACLGVYFLVGEEGRVLVLPYVSIDIGWMMVPLGTFVMVGSSNAFNLTDGLDGLAGGTGLFAFLALGVAIGIVGFSNQQVHGLFIEGALFSLCAAGGLAGFLYWNHYPAKVFMGDTGSLSLGAMIGFIAVLTRLEIVLAVAGAVFVAEAGSVMLQVGYYKATKGKRIFRCAPLHHHFQFGGTDEETVTKNFWMAGLVCAVLAVAMIPTLPDGQSDKGDSSTQTADKETKRPTKDTVVEK